MATKKKLDFVLYWTIEDRRESNPFYTGPVGPQAVINIRMVHGNADVTWSNQQGYRDKADAVRAIMRLYEAMTGGTMSLLDAVDKKLIRVVTPGKKPKIT